MFVNYIIDAVILQVIIFSSHVGAVIDNTKRKMQAYYYFT